MAQLSDASVFGSEFIELYGDQVWTQDIPNTAAAHQFRTELISRIATNRLSYGSGTEKRALESIVELFEKARKITADNIGCGTFEILVWHTLNSVVRQFTAKWHPLSNSGALDALDSSDIFRAELYGIQSTLRELERGLALLEGGASSYDPAVGVANGGASGHLQGALWRPAGGLATFADLERNAVEERRKTYKVTHEDWAAGLAISGGGIRSATFSLGVLAALARRNLLPEFDYLSTVSGGGYTGCFLTSLLGRGDLSPSEGLRSNQLPFKRNEQESELLMGVRQRASFLSAGFIERLLLVMRSSYGVFVNVVLIFSAIAAFAAMEVALRLGFESAHIPTWLAWIFPLASVCLLGVVATKERLQLGELNAWHLILGTLFFAPLVWIALRSFHDGISKITDTFGGYLGLSGLTSSLLVGSIAISLLGGTLAVQARARSLMAAIVTVVFLLFVEHSFFIVFGSQSVFKTGCVLAACAAVVLLLWSVTNVNATSLYRYYRSKLATAFIYVSPGAMPPKVSEIAPGNSLYPIINCALNAPGSEDPRMRGRLADVFSFTPHMTGSTVLGHSVTRDWERWNPTFDLASAMALSGAAVSPQMGLSTSKHGSFWLTLFNARLHAWLRNPDLVPKDEQSDKSKWYRRSPGLGYLVREFMGNADEKLPYVNISDGGHIENLGIYELLRRRCRYIVAIDGEADPRMTFHALTNLQRLAYIDMGIQIDADLDELRLQETGFSRSHFRFCRIRYPTDQGVDCWEVGYLLYVKLSLTGNEGEFLRRYRLDEPTFPHHSTADQFFTETQFEAYRSLGEHVGDKLFMEAIIEDLANKPPIGVQEWMGKYIKNFPPAFAI